MGDLPLRRFAFVVQYLGASFCGWQQQASGRSVQAVLETTIATVVGYPVTIHAAGRTDAGVHAAGQVFHCDLRTPIPDYRWPGVLNARLPEDVLIRATAEVPPTWHARFDATYRRYRYTLYTDPIPNLFLRHQVWHYYQQPLDESRMETALQPLVGLHHLAALQRSNSSRKHAWVDLQEVEIRRRDALIEIEVQARGFLYGMIRLLVGLLVQVGEGSRSPEQFTDIWVNQRRDLVRHSAPAKGLCLLRVGYPDSPFPVNAWFDTQPLFVLPAVSPEALTRDSALTTG